MPSPDPMYIIAPAAFDIAALCVLLVCESVFTIVADSIYILPISPALLFKLLIVLLGVVPVTPEAFDSKYEFPFIITVPPKLYTVCLFALPVFSACAIIRTPSSINVAFSLLSIAENVALVESIFPPTIVNLPLLSRIFSPTLLLIECPFKLIVISCPAEMVNFSVESALISITSPLAQWLIASCIVSYS